MGLIKARQTGAKAAKGDILVFMDSHSECVKQWLEPLSQRIKHSRTSVVMPVTEIISAIDFKFTSVFDYISVGGFSWNGHFKWISPISDRELDRQKQHCSEPSMKVCPLHSPVMVGGYYAIDRSYFWELGGYDEEMEGWGGENLEMSFRIWMCGGTIEAIPCSRIGHISRAFRPYE